MISPTRPALIFDGDERGALIDGPYRYLLWRTWHPGRPRLLWVLLNSSTADADHDDPTLRRLIAFSQREGAGSLAVANLFGWRSAHPMTLRRVADPVGPDNDCIIREAAAQAQRIILGWGNHGALLGRDRAVLELLNAHPLWCLGITHEGQPCHPLYLPANRPLFRFDPRR